MGAVLAPWGFEAVDETVYRAVLRCPGVTVEVLAADLGLPQDEVFQSARRLVRGRLIRRRGDGVAALRPDVALAPWLRQAEAELAHRREELDGIESAVVQFIHEHALGEQDRTAAPVLALVTGWQGFQHTAAQLATQHRGDVLCTLVEPLQRPLAASVREAARELLARGHAIRLLCARDALTRAEHAAVAAEAARAGVAVRVTHRLTTRVLLFARHAALVPGHQDGRLDDDLLLVRSPSVLAALHAMFDLLWERAAPLARGGDGARNADAALLRLMAAGLQDEVVAERLGVSVRTVRRRISALLEQMGARTRFQAGVQAARKGLL